MNAIDLIKAERERQVSAEGWTASHDDTHVRSELASAAGCYAIAQGLRNSIGEFWYGVDKNPPLQWPWSAAEWKPTPRDRIRELVKAGALIVAEIERIQRIGVESAEARCPICGKFGGNNQCSYCCDDPNEWGAEAPAPPESNAGDDGPTEAK